jgi:hypothetical protein
MLPQRNVPNKKCPLIPWDEEAFLLSWFHPPAVRAGTDVRTRRAAAHALRWRPVTRPIATAYFGVESTPVRCRAGGWFSPSRAPWMALTSVPSLAVGARRILVPLFAGCISVHLQHSTWEAECKGTSRRPTACLPMAVGCARSLASLRRCAPRAKATLATLRGIKPR